MIDNTALLPFLKEVNCDIVHLESASSRKTLPDKAAACGDKRLKLGKTLI